VTAPDPSRRPLSRASLSRGHHDRQHGQPLLFTQSLQHLCPAHSWHHHVQQYETGGAAQGIEPRQRLTSIARLKDSVASVLKQISNGLAKVRIVVD
jgi:hypothetical protein